MWITIVENSVSWNECFVHLWTRVMVEVCTGNDGMWMGEMVRCKAL